MAIGIGISPMLRRGGSSANSLLTGMVAAYNFNNSVLDLTGRGNDGTNTNVTYAAGYINNCAVYDTTAYTTLPNNSDLQMSIDIKINFEIN